MKTVWVICRTVDLGYHMVKGYESYDKAKAEFDRMYAEDVAEQVAALMKPHPWPNLTKKQAEDWCAKVTFYELCSLEIEE